MIQTKSNSSAFSRLVPVFISFAVAMVLSVVPLPYYAAILRPDFVALVLIFWCLYYPDRVGLLIAFVVGILLDTMYFGVLGQQALSKLAIAYLILRFAADSDIKRGILFQSVMVLILLLLNVVIITATNRLAYGYFGSHTVWLTPFVGALFWYLFALFLKTRTSRRYGIFE